MASENEKLKFDLQKIIMEKEMLEATTCINCGYSPSHVDAPVTTDPLQYTPTGFYTQVESQCSDETSSHRIDTSDTSEGLFMASTTWDYSV